VRKNPYNSACANVLLLKCSNFYETEEVFRKGGFISQASIHNHATLNLETVGIFFLVWQIEMKAKNLNEKGCISIFLIIFRAYHCTVKRK